MIMLAEQKNETVIFYSDKEIIVRLSVRRDIEYLKDRLRKSDVEEVWASHNHTPEQALMIGYDESAICLTVVNNDVPVAMFGINAKSLISDEAIIWFLASIEIEKIKIRFLKNSRKFIDLFLLSYPTLWNWVDCRNHQSIAWLRFCGARIGASAPYGVEKKNFIFFYFERKDSK